MTSLRDVMHSYAIIDYIINLVNEMKFIHLYLFNYVNIDGNWYQSEEIHTELLINWVDLNRIKYCNYALTCADRLAIFQKLRTESCVPKSKISLSRSRHINYEYNSIIIDSQ